MFCTEWKRWMKDMLDGMKCVDQMSVLAKKNTTKICGTT